MNQTRDELLYNMAYPGTKRPRARARDQEPSQITNQSRSRSWDCKPGTTAGLGRGARRDHKPWPGRNGVLTKHNPELLIRR
ncbi:hypothetical protein BJX65DRAFT_275325 [Aspergillus insuetus]